MRYQLLTTTMALVLACGVACSKSATTGGGSSAPETSASTEPSSSSTTSPAAASGLSGLDQGTVATNLQSRWGVVHASGSRTGQGVDPDTGAELSWVTTGDNLFAVESLTCSVSKPGASSPSSLQAVATSYLAYCATVPYDTANAAKAAAFVRGHLATVKPGHPATTTIGDAEFEVSALPGSTYYLTIRSAKR